MAKQFTLLILFDLNSLDHRQLKRRELHIIYMQKKKNIYAKIISIHYTYTYRFIHIHTQTYCIIGRIVYSFENHSGLLLTVPFDYMIALLRSVKQFQCLEVNRVHLEYKLYF